MLWQLCARRFCISRAPTDSFQLHGAAAVRSGILLAPSATLGTVARLPMPNAAPSKETGNDMSKDACLMKHANRMERHSNSPSGTSHFNTRLVETTRCDAGMCNHRRVCALPPPPTSHHLGARRHQVLAHTGRHSTLGALINDLASCNPEDRRSKIWRHNVIPRATPVQCVVRLGHSHQAPLRPRIAE
ncbi:hypothetical protein BDU57DRAFT_49976 [Ampelomyces quisqualis]|uniref:Uncharacterized protein n=1 Tax=Ampelomyces quisqualis TaxID=50730 RepID=A0A6A5R076_AMPQU|nr:hypothetical protein BDU57DRAFT_49976 [Ampelomyces quisqualis]